MGCPTDNSVTLMTFCIFQTSVRNIISESREDPMYPSFAYLCMLLLLYFIGQNH